MNNTKKSKTYYPLTQNQKAIWLDALLSNDKGTYVIEGHIEFKQRIDIGTFKKALRKAVKETDAFHLVFDMENGNPVQYFSQHDAYELSLLDFSTHKNPETACREWMSQHLERPLEITKARPYNFALLKAGDEHFFFSVIMHHLIIDYVGFLLFTNTLDQYYVAFSSGFTNAEVQKRDSFQHYMQTEYAYCNSENHSLARAYWLDKFTELPPALLDKRNGTESAMPVLEKAWLVPDDLQVELEGLAANMQTHLPRIWMGLLAAYFYKTTKKESLCFGLPIANRYNETENNTIGLLAGVVPLLLHVSPEMTYEELLLHIRDVRRSDRPHQRFSFGELVNELRQAKGKNPSIYDISVNIDNSVIEMEGLNSEYVWRKRGAEQKTPMTFFFKPCRGKKNWEIKVAFLPEYFSLGAAEKMLMRFETLLWEVVRNPAQSLESINMLPMEEKQLLLKSYNNTNANFPLDKTIVDLFEKQAENTPDNVALVFENKTLSYKELNEKSNALAHHLLANYDINPDDIVGLQVERNEWIVIGILGILKAGAAYLPMGIDLPEARVAFMLEDSKASLLLTNRGGTEAANLHRDKLPVLVMEDIVEENSESHFQNPGIALNPAHLAYIIYTSGSTGNPKGVMIEHRNVVRLMVNDRPLFDFNEKDVWSLFHYYGFDFSVWEIWGALLFGGSLVVVPKQATLHPEAFVNLLLEKQVTVLNQVPSTFEQVQIHLLESRQMHHIRYVIFGGAKLIPETLRAWKNRFPDTRLINMYGITETTVHVTYKEIKQADIDAGISNVGKPIPTLRCYILDEKLNLAPVGVPGEIYVAGAGLARGYLNNEELTAARFVENPFGPGRLYKSGDSGQWLENGDIEFFGRIDFQLKIRGFRIEAGEIEQKLLECDGVQSVVVIGKEIKHQTELVAYLSGNNNKRPELETLRNALKQALPAYMIPAHFVWLEKFPLTKNGKTDRKALPAPDGLTLASGTTFVPPGNPTEKALVTAFADVLSREVTEISMLDDFFNLGGDSIKLIRLVGKIHEHTGIKISPAKVYNTSQVKALANYLLENKTSLKTDASELEKQQLELRSQFEALKARFLASEVENTNGIEDVFPMSDIQRGMVFGNLLYENEGVYHDQTVYDLGPVGFEKKRFEKALRLMVAKHANLRTTFRLNFKGEDLQLVHQSIDLPLRYQETPGYHKGEFRITINTFLKTERHKGFDLENGPLWRMDIFQPDAENPLLIFQFHHAIFDGWSLASLNTELLKTYHQLGLQPDFQPEPFRLSYKDFVIRERITKQEESIRNFWKQELAGFERTDLFREEIIDDEFEITVGKNYWQGLTSLAAKLGVSTKTLSLSAYLLLLEFLSPQQELVIGVISNNRLPEGEGDLLLGSFLNTVPLRIPIDKKKNAPEFVRQVKEKIQSLRGNDQMTTMEIARLTGESTTEGNPIFDVIFNYIDFHIYDDLNDIGIGTERMLRAELSGVTTFFERTNTYFDLMVNTTGNNLSLKVQLSRKLKAGYSAKEVLYKYLDVLDILQEKPEINLKAISLLSETERHRLVHDFNATSVPFDGEKTIVHLFEEQAERTPDRVALVFEDTFITYKELEKRSRQLASYLQQKGVQADTLVGLCMERSIEMMVAIWGILRAGGAYVPLDPGYPKERVAHMLEDGIVNGNKTNAPKIVITQKHLNEVVEHNTEGLNISLVVLAAEWERNESILKASGILENKPCPQDLIYVIFTSGSTGKPKGTLVHHQGFHNLMHWYNNDFNFNAESKFLLVSSINFDLTQKNLYAPLLLGGSLHMTGAENYDLVAINDMIRDHKITNINCTPSIFYGFVDEAAARGFESLQSLEYVFLGGEPINMVKLADWYNNPLNKAKLVNSYGPTECSDVVSYYVIEDNKIQTIPIGKPICNTQLYVLDADHNLVLPGIQGELCIAGAGVGRGYLHNPELTNEKFITNPFDESTLLYKTGDHARWLPDGNIEFLGRADHQLKIRGYRVEAGEIEDVLLSHPAVRLAIVMGKEIAGAKELIAYLIGGEQGLPSLEILRNYLATRLPDYMVPAYFVGMDEFPLTPSGKVNRRALPAPEETGLASSISYVAPRTRTEGMLARIWEEVLGRTSIGIYDNFFHLGGHSLRVIRLVSMIQQAFGVKLRLSEIFANPTIATLAIKVTGHKTETQTVIQPLPPQETYAVSNAQYRLWVMDQLEENQTAYNMPMVLRMKGQLNIRAIQVAFERLVNRHEILRTNIVEVDGVPRQVIQTVGQFKVLASDWKNRSKQDWQHYMLEFAQQAFNLEKDALIRLELVQLAEAEHLLLFNLHHSIFDGWSMQVLLKEIKYFYEAFVNKEFASLPELTIQYKEYAAWKRNLLKQETLLEDLKRYWHYKLAPGEEGLPVLELPTDYLRPPIQTFEGSIITKTFSKDLLDGLKTLSREAGATLFMTLTAVVKVLLYRYSGQRDILVGTPSSGRGNADFQQQLGFYVNMLVLRNSIEDVISFRDFLERVKQTTLEAMEHEDYPFEQLVESLGLVRDMSRSPLFDVLVAYQDDPGDLSFGNVEALLENVDWGTSKYDLSFGFVPGQNGLSVDIEFNTSIYKADRIHRMFEHLECLMESIIRNPDKPVSMLELMNSSEKQLVLHGFNNNATSYNLDQLVSQMFETQVEKSPEGIAFIFEEKEWTYRALNEQANRLGNYLQTVFQIKGDDIVALQLERSEWMFIAMLGVMKAGGAYLPIAADAPEKRTAFMLEDSAACLLLTDKSTFAAARVFESMLPVVAVEQAQSDNSNNVITNAQSTNLAYVIYTSGSTGNPKGVMLEHRSVVNMLYGQIEDLEVTENDTTLQFAPYTFDASVPEFFMGLSVGATMILADRATLLSTEHFRDLMHRYKVTLADIPPSFLAILDEAALKDVRLLITAGEAAIVQDVKKYSSKLQYVNIYGPTETCVVVASFKVPISGYEAGNTIPIGKPVRNMNIFVVDKNLQLVPVGVPGEIVISGVGLARGYLNNDSLNEEKFPPAPFLNGERIYRTGDLGCWQADGNLDFMGRIDYQLKIRGHRIETEEIESALMSHDVVKAAVVLGRSVNGTKELVAYLVFDEQADALDVAGLRTHLSKYLPDYMIPAYFVKLDKMPLTSHDKVDRKALPQPDANNSLKGSDYVAPDSEMEQLLVKVWEEVLQWDGIGIKHNFFHIGGDSIKALQICGRLGAMGWSLNMKDVFTHPNIQQLATMVTNKKKDYPQELLTGPVELTAIQHWFFEHVRTDKHHFNQSFVFKAARKLDVGLLQKSLEAVIEHHDMLRANYVEKDGLVQQTIGKNTMFKLEVVAINTTEDAAAVIGSYTEKIQQQFFLAQGGLVKGILFQKDTGDELFLTIHHLVVDGVSWRILQEDLITAYQQLEAGELVRLAPKTAPFAWWSEAMLSYAASPDAAKHFTYWEKLLSNKVDRICADYPAEANTVGDCSRVLFKLNKTKTKNLLQNCNRAYNTEINDILLCGLSRALHKVFGGKAYQVMLEGHGREALFDMDVSRTVGWFTAAFPVLLDYNADLGTHVQLIKEQLHRIPNKGVDYGILRYLNSQSLQREEQVDISFNYLGSFSGSEKTDLLTIIDTAAGEDISPSIERDAELDVSCVITDGQLEITVTFHKARMDNDKMQAMVREFGHELSLLITHCSRLVTTTKTPVDFTACDLTLEQYHGFLSTLRFKPDDIEDIYTLSPLQEGMLFHKLMNPASPAYFNQLQLCIEGAVDVPHFKYCWEQILQANPALRTSFHSNGLPAPLQLVHKAVELNFTYNDIRKKSEAEQTAVITNFVETDRKKGFDLSEQSLMRLMLFQTGETTFRLVISDHHIAMDGWSQAVLLQDLKRLYRKEITTLEVKPFAPYISWLRQKPEEEGLAFWKDYLQGYEEAITVLKLQHASTVANVDPQTEVLLLDKSKTKALEQLARSRQVSLNTVVQSIWAIILGTYNQKQDVVFGMTTSGRSAAVKDIESLSGLFINTVPLRVSWKEEHPFADFLAHVQQQSLAAQEFEYFSLAGIQSVWEGQGELLDHMIAFENYPSGNNAGRYKDDLNFTATNGYDPVHYDFGMSIGLGEALIFHLNYNRAALSSAQVQRIKAHIETVITTILDNPEIQLGEIRILPEAEKQLLLTDFNDTDANFPTDKTIVDLFEEQVERTPNRIAVVFHEQELTYRELNNMADHVAALLVHQYKIQPDEIVALQTGNNEWMLVGILGILKAGAAYLPVGYSLPDARVDFMLRDSSAKVLLSDRLKDQIPEVYNNLIPVVTLQEAVKGKTDKSRKAIARKVAPCNLAYIIYTSGSTGTPKGVMIEHRNVVRLMFNDRSLFDFNEKDVWTLFHYYGFDFSVWEIWGALLFGGKLVVVPEEATVNPGAFAELLLKHQVTVLNQVPSTFEQVQEHLLKLSGEKTALRYIIFGGAKLIPAILQEWHSRYPATRLINMYGITETTVHVTFKEIGAKEIEAGISNIGVPIPTLRCYILDQKLRPVPVGVIGEIYVAGDGLARGYLNQPELTAARFIENPFEKGTRLYKSGDLARWLDNGDLEFFGRIDFQLKIRGYRIEAGEIEQAILNHPAIRSCVVTGKQVGQVTELVAYLVSHENDAMPSMTALRNLLAEKLPDYMIPSYFIPLENMVLTKNGKVDLKALPEPGGSTLASGTAFDAPRTKTEEQLAAVWREVLERDEISIHDHFFHLGGHSLKAIRLSGLLQEQFNLQVPLQLIFQYPVLADLADQLEQLLELEQGYTHALGLQLNPGNQPMVFTFPPFFGLSIWYTQLAAHMQNTSFYCFDFLVDENRLELYYQQIKKEQPEGPYLFFGYSAGGSLAYEMAAFMEAKGDTVAAVVLGDSMIVSDMKTDMEKYLNDLSVALSTRKDETAAGLLELISHKVLRKQCVERLSVYEDFLNSCTSRNIQADIYLIKAELASDIPGMHQRWQEFTTGRCIVENGKGDHDYLFEQSNLAHNGKLLATIFKLALHKYQRATKGA